MLHHLSIRNIVLIRELDIALQPGLVVLTGETGAGKSILLDALGFCLGGRGNARLLRHGAEQGVVTATFDIVGNKTANTLLEAHGLEMSDTLLLRRVLYKDGKSRAFVNDTPVSVSYLRDMADTLIEIHGQHDQRGLLDTTTHRLIVDAFGQLENKVTEVNSAYDTYAHVQEELAALNGMVQNAEKEEQYLRHVQQELLQLAPQPGEEDALVEQRTSLMQREKLISTIGSALQELKGQHDVQAAIASAQRVLTRQAAPALPAYQEATEALERAHVEITEAMHQLQSLLGDADGYQATLERIQERLFTLREAARKYRVPVEELSAYLTTIQHKLSLLESHEERLKTLETALVESRGRYIAASDHLTTARKKTAIMLEAALVKELNPLKMEGACFNVAVDVLPETSWSRDGVDKIRFLVSTNPGTPPDELAKIASGGELSRFMLALKVVLAKVKFVPTLIFDEVDTGIGGAVADAVGKRLELLGKHAQVLVVTHQPQVAARGSQHLYIKKQQQDGQTFTSVTALTLEARKEELARMLSGAKITKEALAAAESLMEIA